MTTFSFTLNEWYYTISRSIMKWSDIWRYVTKQKGSCYGHVMFLILHDILRTTDLRIKSLAVRVLLCKWIRFRRTAFRVSGAFKQQKVTFTVLFGYLRHVYSKELDIPKLFTLGFCMKQSGLGYHTDKAEGIVWNCGTILGRGIGWCNPNVVA